MGLKIALSGILVVFAGLVLIAAVIVVFNKISAILRRRAAGLVDQTGIPSGIPSRPGSIVPLSTMEDIPEDDLIAITTAVELYRKIHFETLPSEITFMRGEDAQNAWKMGNKYGQRESG